nr:hypothetical protein [Tanacetum cinerariifolium]
MLVYVLQLRTKLFASNSEPMVVRKGGFCLFSLKDFPFVLVIDLLYFLLDIVEDALAQGADGLGLMKNEDHQVLGNEQKLKEDTSDCTKKDKCYIFILLLIICIVLMQMDRASYAHSCERVLLKSKVEFSEQPTMHVAGAASRLNTPKEN